MKRVLSVILASLLLITMIAFVQTPAAKGQTSGRAVVRHRHKRTFWQKHRDKLTVAGSTLGGAAIGGLAGGKRGAAIGSLAGAGGGALYTYKLRKRHRHRHRRY